MKWMPVQFAVALSVVTVACLPPSSDVICAHVVGPEYTATLSKRNSGAMSRGSTLVSVIANGVPDNATHGVVVLGISGDRSVQMQWRGPRALSLGCQQCASKDVNFQAIRAGNVTISYGDGCNVINTH
jgi:hypothetical protein